MEHYKGDAQKRFRFLEDIIQSFVESW